MTPPLIVRPSVPSRKEACCTEDSHASTGKQLSYLRKEAWGVLHRGMLSVRWLVSGSLCREIPSRVFFLWLLMWQRKIEPIETHPSSVKWYRMFVNCLMSSLWTSSCPWAQLWWGECHADSGCPARKSACQVVISSLCDLTPRPLK